MTIDPPPQAAVPAGIEPMRDHAVRATPLWFAPVGAALVAIAVWSPAAQPEVVTLILLGLTSSALSLLEIRRNAVTGIPTTLPKTLGAWARVVIAATLFLVPFVGSIVSVAGGRPEYSVLLAAASFVVMLPVILLDDRRERAEYLVSLSRHHTTREENPTAS